jgi:hypothetical protein
MSRDLADIGGETGAATHRASIAGPGRRPKGSLAGHSIPICPRSRQVALTERGPVNFKLAALITF